jgi:hypothetical protein
MLDKGLCIAPMCVFRSIAYTMILNKKNGKLNVCFLDIMNNKDVVLTEK